MHNLKLHSFILFTIWEVRHAHLGLASPFGKLILLCLLNKVLDINFLLLLVFWVIDVSLVGPPLPGAPWRALQLLLRSGHVCGLLLLDHQTLRRGLSRMLQRLLLLVAYFADVPLREGALRMVQILRVGAIRFIVRRRVHWFFTYPSVGLVVRRNACRRVPCLIHPYLFLLLLHRWSQFVPLLVLEILDPLHLLIDGLLLLAHVHLSLVSGRQNCWTHGSSLNGSDLDAVVDVLRQVQSQVRGYS